MIINKSQNTKPKSDNIKVRRSPKIESALRSTFETIKSAKIVKAKNERPRSKPLVNPRIEGKTAKVKRPITKQSTATATSTVLNDGRKNKEE